MMHFTIIGAGAIGGTIGAYLARAGHPVVVVDQAQDHVEAINRAGLLIEGQESFRVHVPAFSPAELPQVSEEHEPEAILLCVKAMHTEEALESILPILRPESFVVSMQNGLNERVIAARIGMERTIGAFVNFGADYLEPGKVLFGGAGALYLGELDGRMTPRLRRLEEILRTSFLPNTQATDNIWGYLWGKLAYGSMLYATALVDATMADVLAHPRFRPTLANLAAEVVMVAEAEGVRCEGFDGFTPQVFRFQTPRDWEGIMASLDRLVAFNRQSLKQKSGIWRDLAVRRRRTEVDHHVGVVVSTAQAHGLEAPLNEKLTDLIHDLESGFRQMGWENLEELAAINYRVYPD